MAALVVTACDGGSVPDDARIDARTAFTCEELAALPMGTACDQPMSCVTCGGSGCGIDCYDGRVTRVCLACDAGIGTDVGD